MIHVDDGAVRVKGSLPEVLEDFVIILMDIQELLADDFGEEAANKAISILGKVAFLDDMAESYETERQALSKQLADVLSSGEREMERG